MPGIGGADWLEDREAELLPMPYFHVVFSLPAEIADIAYQNKAVVYDLLFKVSADVMLTIAADPEHLGAKIAITSVLHTWGSALMHHPYVHMIAPGGGLSPACPGRPAEGAKWIAGSARFLLPVRVLSALFRRRMLEALAIVHKAGKLQFFNELAHLADATAFADCVEPLKIKKWHVYAKCPFAGPKAVLAYLARYTHRVAISNSRLLAIDERGVTFRVKNYKVEGAARYTTMTLPAHELMRRFLLHVLPKGLHRIRHYGLLANGQKEPNLAKARTLLGVKSIDPTHDVPRRAENGRDADAPRVLPTPCPCCGARMFIIETFEGVCRPRPHAPASRVVIRIDTS